MQQIHIPEWKLTNEHFSYAHLFWRNVYLLLYAQFSNIMSFEIPYHCFSAISRISSREEFSSLKSPRIIFRTVFSALISSSVLIPQRLIKGTGGHQPCRACCSIKAPITPVMRNQNLLNLSPSTELPNSSTAAFASRIRSVSHSRFRSLIRSVISSLFKPL